jgi:hypothetical protein
MQPTVTMTMANTLRVARSRAPARHNALMWLLLLEAVLALAVLVFIVWWTMFSGRRRGERARSGAERPSKPPVDDPPR